MASSLGAGEAPGVSPQREPALSATPPATGRVKLFSLERGYGFIRPEGGEADAYFLRANVEKPKGFVRVGDRVKYEVVKTDKGPQIMHIIRIDDAGNEDETGA